MSVLASAIADLFADAALAEEALYLPALGGSLAVRVIRRQPDEAFAAFSGRAAVPGLLLEVRARDVATPAEGDRIAIGETVWRVQAVRPDAHGLLWTLDLGPA